MAASTTREGTLPLPYKALPVQQKVGHAVNQLTNLPQFGLQIFTDSSAVNGIHDGGGGLVFFHDTVILHWNTNMAPEVAPSNQSVLPLV